MKGSAPIHRRFLDHFDPVMGAIGGSFLFVMVFIAKWPDGVRLAAIAGGKQFLFNFLMGGILMKLCENLAVKSSERGRALLLAVLIPSVINVSITYLIQLSNDGDVHPFRSTLPSLFWAPAAYIWWSRLKRRKAEDVRGDG